ncbi:MAG: hypothetical protein ACYCYO_05335 [Bacilli bacterium]
MNFLLKQIIYSLLSLRIANRPFIVRGSQPVSVIEQEKTLSRAIILAAFIINALQGGEKQRRFHNNDLSNGKRRVSGLNALLCLRVVAGVGVSSVRRRTDIMRRLFLRNGHHQCSINRLFLWQFLLTATFTKAIGIRSKPFPPAFLSI